MFKTLQKQKNLKTSGKQLFDVSVYQTDTATSNFHDMVRNMSSMTEDADPTPFHHMIATMADEDRVLRVYTQNVDGLETRLPPLATSIPLGPKGPWPRTVQLHGSLNKMVCSKCNTLSPFDGALFDGPVPPTCPECVSMDTVRTGVAGKRSHGIGRLRPRMVLYNEPNPDADAIGNVSYSDLQKRPDMLIVVGTTMEIPGVKRLVQEMSKCVRSRKNGLTVWINRDPPPTTAGLEDLWDLCVTADCDQVARIANLRRWDETVPVTEEEAAEAVSKDGAIHVVVTSKEEVNQKPVEAAKDLHMMPTPGTSPSPENISQAKHRGQSAISSTGKLEPSIKRKSKGKSTVKGQTKLKADLDAKKNAASISKKKSSNVRKPKQTIAKAKRGLDSKINSLKGSFSTKKILQNSSITELEEKPSTPATSCLKDIPAQAPSLPESHLTAPKDGLPLMHQVTGIMTPDSSAGIGSPIEFVDIETPQTMGKTAAQSRAEIIHPRGTTPPDMRRLLCS